MRIVEHRNGLPHRFITESAENQLIGMNKILRLKDLANNLDKDFYIKLKHEFLKELLIDASKSKYPHRNKGFVKKIGWGFNRKKPISLGLYLTIRYNRSVPILKIKRILTLSKYNWDDIERNLISLNLGKRNGDIYPNFPITVGKELGSIIGHILGDGSIDKVNNALFFSNSNRDLLEEFMKYMRDVFSIEPRIYVQKGNGFDRKSEWLGRIYNLDDFEGRPAGLYYPKASSIFLHSVFGKFALGKKKSITRQIMSSPIELKKYLIRAFFDDEGSVSSNSHTIRVHQDDYKILEHVRSLLIEIGIESGKICKYIKRGKKRHYLNINGYRNYKRFSETIGFTSRRKSEELNRLIEKIESKKSFRLRQNETKNFILSIL